MSMTNIFTIDWIYYIDPVMVPTVFNKGEWIFVKNINGSKATGHTL